MPDYDPDIHDVDVYDGLPDDVVNDLKEEERRESSSESSSSEEEKEEDPTPDALPVPPDPPDPPPPTEDVPPVVPDVPEPPEFVAVPKRLPRTIVGDWVTIAVTGGYLKWSKALKRCDAHCTVLGHGGPSKCKMDCTVGDQRPVARQTAWLAVGSFPEVVASSAEHVALKADIGTADYVDVRQEARLELVERSAHEPLIQELLEYEGGIDDPEPDVIAYRKGGRT